jgi:hypothetical protein
MMILFGTIAAVFWAVGAAILLWLYFWHGNGGDRPIVVIAWVLGLTFWPIAFPTAWMIDGVVLAWRRRRRLL